MANKISDEIILPSCFFYEGKVVKVKERSGRTSIVQNFDGDSFLVSNAQLKPIPICEHEGKYSIWYCPFSQILERTCSNYFCRNYKVRTE